MNGTLFGCGAKILKAMLRGLNLKLQSWCNTLSGVLGRLIRRAAALLFLLSVLIACYEVVMRFTFGFSHDWGNEVILTLMLYAVFLGAVVAMRERKHTRIEVFLKMLTGKRRLWVDTILIVITTVTCGGLAWSGVKIVHTLYFHDLVTPSSLGLSCWIRFLALPVSLGFCALIGLKEMTRLISEHFE